MLFGLAIFAVAAAVASAMIMWALAKAPEGYEDALGFHFLKKRTPGAKVVRSKARRIDPAVGSVGEATIGR